jgi:hypothetical protein
MIRLRNRKLVISLAILLAVLLLGFVTFNKYSRRVSVTIPSSSPTSPAKQPPAGKNNASSSSAAATSEEKTAATTPSQGSSLILNNSQTFVSNHKPGQNGASTAEQSACITTPGATCSMQFTKGSTIKTLEAKTADSNGTVIWNWDVQDAGFTSGSWEISTTAKLNDQTKTVRDPMSLEIP